MRYVTFHEINQFCVNIYNLNLFNIEKCLRGPDLACRSYLGHPYLNTLDSAWEYCRFRQESENQIKCGTEKHSSEITKEAVSTAVFPNLFRFATPCGELEAICFKIWWSFENAFLNDDLKNVLVCGIPEYCNWHHRVPQHPGWETLSYSDKLACGILPQISHRWFMSPILFFFSLIITMNTIISIIKGSVLFFLSGVLRCIWKNLYVFYSPLQIFIL